MMKEKKPAKAEDVKSGSKFAPTVAELRGVVDTKDFNNFQRRRYNMDKLEQQLLETGRQELLKIEENQGGYINGN